jgi:hypothetical protein
MKVEMNVKLHVELRYEIHTLADLTPLCIGEGWVGVVVKRTVNDTYANRKALGGWFFFLFLFLDFKSSNNFKKSKENTRVI